MLRCSQSHPANVQSQDSRPHFLSMLALLPLIFENCPSGQRSVHTLKPLFLKEFEEIAINNLDIFCKYGNIKIYKTSRAVLQNGDSACSLPEFVSHLFHFAAGESDTS